MRCLHRFVLALALTGALLAGCSQEAPPAQAPPPVPEDSLLPFEQAHAIGIRCVETNVRLDAPPTPENSYLQEFAPGVVLHVPKCIEPGIDFTKVQQPIKAKAVSMTFVFPDMTTASEMQGTVEKYLLKQQGKYVPQTDRFPVFVIWLWYVNPDTDTFVPGSKQPDFEFEPRPPRMELNQHCYPFVDGRCVNEMVRIESGINGIDANVSLEWSKTHPDILHHDLRKGGSYVAKRDAPYELLMDCGGVAGSNCQAHMYSKAHHLQLRMVFPAEGVEHANELFEAIDRMLGRWTSTNADISQSAA